MIAAAKAPASEYEATRTTWRAQVDSDPDIKSAVMDGKAGLDAVKIGISKTLAALGDPALTADFKTAMDLTGAATTPHSSRPCGSSPPSSPKLARRRCEAEPARPNTSRPGHPTLGRQVPLPESTRMSLREVERNGQIVRVDTPPTFNLS